MIRVVWHPNWFELGTRHTDLVAFRDGMRVADALPGPFLQSARDPDLAVWRNGVRVGFEEPLQDHDWVHAMIQPQGSALAVGKFIGALIATTVITRFFLSRLDPGAERDDRKSATYDFRGIQPSRGQGLTIARHYGRMRSGGQVINELVDATGFGGSSVYAVQISFGEGPIYAIGDVTADTPLFEPRRTGSSNPPPSGILIEGNAVENIPDVEAHIRLGDNVQEWTPGFQFTVASNPVDLELTAATTTSDANNSLMLTVPALADDALWDTYGQTVDLNAAEYDGARVRITFPSGLFGLDASGNLQHRHFALAMRYIELDGGGSPITSGGQFSDGWVRLPPTQYERHQIRGLFSLDFRADFFDPSTYVAPVLGKALATGGKDSSGTASSAQLTSPANWPAAWQAAGGDLDSITVSLWVRPEAGELDLLEMALVDHYDASNGGYRLAIRQKTFQEAPGATSDHFVPVLEVANVGVGNPTEFYEHRDGTLGRPTAELFGAQWYHLAFSVKADALGPGLDRIRLYVDGEMVWEDVGSFNLKNAGSAQTLYIGRDPAQVGSFYGLIDEMDIVHDEVPGNFIARRYADGLGVYTFAGTHPTIGGGNANIVLGYHFDENATSGQIDDWSGLGNHATHNGSARTTSDGVIYVPAGNTPKRAKYRLQVMRANLDSTSSNTSDQANLLEVQGLLNEQFSYPNSPRLDLKVRGGEAINTAEPAVTAIIYGGLCPVWDGADAKNPVFLATYTANPAWVAADMILDKRFGAGQFFEGFDLDVLSFKEWADECDGRIYDNRDSRQDGEQVGSPDWTDIRYQSSDALNARFDGRGVLKISGFSARPPASWVAGAEVGITGSAAIITAGTWVSIDTPEGSIAPGAYLIDSVFEVTPGNWQVWLYWDRISEGDPWTDGDFMAAHVSAGTVTGTWEGRRRRHEYNAVHDTAEGFWDALLSVCSVGRAFPIREGRRIRIKVNKARSPVAFVSQANIVKDSFEVEYGGNQDEPNSLTISFLDREFDYARSQAIVEDPAIQNSASLDEVRQRDISLRGVTDRAQAMRQGTFLLNVNRLIDKRGRFRLGPDGIHLEPGDVVIISHDLAPWGTGGRILVQEDADTVKLDREVTLLAATTYYLRVRNPRLNTFETVEVDVAGTGGAGTYASGTAIELLASFTFTPDHDDLYVLYADGSELLAEISQVILQPDQGVELEWVKYDAGVFSDDFGEVPLVTAGTDTTGDASSKSSKIPDPVARVGVLEETRQGADGSDETHLVVTWEPPASGIRAISHFAVWTRVDDGPFVRAGRAGKDERSLDIQVPAARARAALSVAVQPVTLSGVARPPSESTVRRVRLVGQPTTPTAPTSLEIELEGVLAEYRITPANRARLWVHEIRIGGWVLGQPVANLPHGQLAECGSSAWAGGSSDTDQVPYFARAKGIGGMPSDYIRTLTTLKAADAEPLIQFTRAAANWESVSDFEPTDVPPPVLTDVQVDTDVEGLPFLELSGSALTGTYETSRGDVSTGSKTRRVLVEAWADAEQVHPMTFDDWPALDSEEMRRWTFEGPMWLLEGEEECSLRIEFNPTIGGSEQGWMPLNRGITRASSVRFRLTLTRPSTSFNVRVYKFHTRVSQAPRDDTRPTQAQRAGESRLLGHG